MIDPRDVISALLAVVATYFWYDKTKVDKTLEDYKERLRQLENKQSVLETKLDGIREMLDVKFDMVMKALERRD
jgi:predicted LPLAT superfamily acyltransferase